MATRLQEILVIPTDEKFRRESFAIHTARRGEGALPDQPIRFSIKGESEPGEFKPNLSYRLWGKWEPENQYGPTFAFNSFAVTVPHGKAGVTAYLRQARHVGEAIALTLWEVFRGEAVRILREEPERASEAVGKRFPIEKAREAAADLEPLRAAEGITQELFDLFDGRGFGKACVRQAIQIWGADAVRVLRDHPYMANRLRGVGFKKADQFYLDLGKDPNAIERQVQCLTYYVEQTAAQDGHVWIAADIANACLRSAIGGTTVTPDKALAGALEERLLVSQGRV